MQNSLQKWVLDAYRFIFARPQLRKFNILLFHLSLRGLGLLNYNNAKVSGELNFINNILPKLVYTKNPILFDVGANCGTYTRFLSERFPNAHIYAFEPHPKSFSILKSTKFSNVKYYNIGLGEEKGKSMLYDREDEDGLAHASLYKEVITEIHKQTVKSLEVNIERLDGVIAKEKIGYIDFIKIDCEGSEFSILKNARALIEKDMIGCVHFEFNEMAVISRYFLRDFRKLLPRHSFYRILPYGLLELDHLPIVLTELFAYQNILAIPINKHE